MSRFTTLIDSSHGLSSVTAASHMLCRTCGIIQWSRYSSVAPASRRSNVTSTRANEQQTVPAEQHSVLWNPHRGKARSKFGVIKAPTDSISMRISQRLQLPKFRAKSSNIKILKGPALFYSEVKAMISRAQGRIFLSSLYIGKDESELIGCIRRVLQDRPYLKVVILSDALRSTREGPLQQVDGKLNTSCASLLASLVRDFPHQVDVRLYRTPGLPLWLEKMIGKRLVEGVGLQHMKIYGVDDEVIVSGANLSSDYFTNRQDRYVHIRQHRFLCNYLHSLILLVSQFSYNLKVPTSSSSSLPLLPDHSAYTLHWDNGSSLLLFEDEDGSVSEDAPPANRLTTRTEHDFADSAGKAVQEFTERWRVLAETHTALEQSNSDSAQDFDTRIVPLLQMGPLRITQETETMPILFRAIEEEEESRKQLEPASKQGNLKFPIKATIDFTSGYFSLYPPYKSLILNAASAIRTRIITAAPESNGFFGSKGISRHLPPAYTWLEKKFWEAVKSHRKRGSVEIREWQREGWTYHAKGVWYTASTNSSPTLTMLGSSNFGSRSALRDLECTLLIETPASSSLSRSLKSEIEELREHATVPVNDDLFRQKDRKVHWGVRLATEVLKGRL